VPNTQQGGLTLYEAQKIAAASKSAV
jgi:hypothetical protein